jgi:L-seryl-tRNA(Ser) seleniumtransferase
VIVGSTAAVARLRANPLLRALRVDKATLAALAATLRLHADAATRERIPLYRMLATPVAALRDRARVLRAQFPVLDIVETDGFAGGGTLPLAPIASVGVAFLPPRGATAAAARLRACTPPLIARIDDARIVIDLRTIDPADDVRVAGALAALFAAD